MLESIGKPAPQVACFLSLLGGATWMRACFVTGWHKKGKKGVKVGLYPHTFHIINAFLYLEIRFKNRGSFDIAR